MKPLIRFLLDTRLNRRSIKELRQYLSEHRQDEEKFSQALEILMSQKQEKFKYPPPYEMDQDEIEAIFQAKLNQQ